MLNKWLIGSTLGLMVACSGGDSSAPTPAEAPPEVKEAPKKNP